ncbi:hypothetical protein C0R05_24555 [Streptomyces albidoflavus]|nr:hypothetical protein C0R05_24555 [Streptomyces albidoflavus]
MLPQEKGAPVSVSNQRRAAVYRLFSADGTLLYIGSSYAPDRRCAVHRRKSWWPLVARREEEWHPNRSAAYTAESNAIRAEAPLHNRMCKTDYEAPVTPAVLGRIADNRVRGKVSGEAARVQRRAIHKASDAGHGWDEAQRQGELAWIRHIEASGLFPGWAARRRRSYEDRYGAVAG